MCKAQPKVCGREVGELGFYANDVSGERLAWHGNFLLGVIWNNLFRIYAILLK